MKKHAACLVVVIAVLGVGSLSAVSPTYTFQPFDYNPTIATEFYAQTFPRDINDAGAIIGISKPVLGLNKTGFITNTADLTVITPLVPPAWAPGQYGRGINNAGDIGGGGGGDPYLYDNASGTFLAIPTGTGYDSVEDVNDDQDVIGRANVAGYHYSGAGNHTPINVPGATTTFPDSVNNLDHVVGSYAQQPLVIEAGFLYKGGTYYDVAITAEDRTSVRGINNAGDMVGRATTSPSSLSQGIGFLYTGGAFYGIEITGALSSAATAIDNHGRILGWYVGSGALDVHGFVGFPSLTGQGLALPEIQGTITEIPEPATLSLLGLGALAMMRRRRRRLGQ